MSKYELTDTQVKQLINIISNANIKGSEAPIVVALARALQMPVKELEKKKEKDEKGVPEAK